MTAQFRPFLTSHFCLCFPSVIDLWWIRQFSLFAHVQLTGRPEKVGKWLPLRILIEGSLGTCICSILSLSSKILSLSNASTKIATHWFHEYMGTVGATIHWHGGNWGGKIPPPPLWKIAAGGLRGKNKRGEEREKEKGRKRKRERKEKEKERKRGKGREKSKLKVFLKYSFWLGVQAR